MFAAAADKVTGTRITYPIEFTFIFPIDTVGVAANASDSPSTFTYNGKIGRNCDDAELLLVLIAATAAAADEEVSSLSANIILYLPGLRSARYLIVNVSVVSV